MTGIALGALVCLTTTPLPADSGHLLTPAQASIVIPPGEEAMGREFIAAARQQLAFVEDPLLVRYVENLGQRLAAGLGGDTDRLRFFLIESKLVNAFAGPGGRLAVFTGLVTTTRSEAELASVMAHEIAHVAQRHLPRMMERAARRKIPTTAGILAAILLGGQAGAAAMAATTGAAMSDQLRYSREFEREADVL
ncbi:MAG: M48 family metalloprotease, partial [Pseudomonadota bacterium]|nr:M48 family metalloprotease [Pseudomonadota bacterium]